MARIPLTEKNIITVMRQASHGRDGVFYPITLQITLDGNRKEICVVLEKLAAKGSVKKYKSKIPFVGYGYYLPKD